MVDCAEHKFQQVEVVFESLGRCRTGASPGGEPAGEDSCGPGKAARCRALAAHSQVATHWQGGGRAKGMHGATVKSCVRCTCCQGIHMHPQLRVCYMSAPT